MYVKYFATPETWMDAQQLCESHGGNLALILNWDEDRFLFGKPKENN